MWMEIGKRIVNDMILRIPIVLLFVLNLGQHLRNYKMDNLDILQQQADKNGIYVDVLEQALIAENFKILKKSYPNIDVDGDITLVDNCDFSMSVQISIYRPRYIINKYDKNEQALYTLASFNKVDEVVDYFSRDLKNSDSR